MPYSLPADLDRIVRDRVATGRYRDADAVLRAALTALDEADCDLPAIEAAIGEWKAGDEGLPVDEAFAQVRSEHQHASGQ